MKGGGGLNNLQLIESVIIYIDNHLADEVTFDIIADEFGYSSFHFHKMFTVVTGQTIADYIRKRRLEYALLNIVETDKNISTVCFDNGFKSIQTFNRLFKQTYGLLPSEARKNKISSECKSIQSIITAYQKRIHFKGEFIMEPKFIEREEFFLAGLRKHTSNGWQVIGESWSELKSKMDHIDRVNINVMYGFEDYSEDFSSNPLEFYYMAAVEVLEDTIIPEGWIKRKIPKSEYAVFTVNGNNSEGEIGKTFRYIYDVWLPNSEYCISDELCADFEYYDERWNCQSKSAQIDLYIPVKKLGDM